MIHDLERIQKKRKSNPYTTLSNSIENIKKVKIKMNALISKGVNFYQSGIATSIDQFVDIKYSYKPDALLTASDITVTISISCNFEKLVETIDEVSKEIEHIDSTSLANKLLNDMNIPVWNEPESKSN